MRAAVAILAACGAAAAMDAASVGVIDWEWKQVGTPHTSVAVSAKRQVWATDQNVVAGIATRTGKLDWRFVLPEGERIVAAAAAPAVHGSAVDVLSHSEQGCVLRRVDADGGSPVWDVLAEAGAAPPAGGVVQAGTGAFAVGFGLVHASNGRRIVVSCRGRVSAVAVSGSAASDPVPVSLSGGAAASALLRSGTGAVAVVLGLSEAGRVVSAGRTGVIEGEAAAVEDVSLPGWPEAGCEAALAAAGTGALVVACGGASAAVVVPASGIASARRLPSPVASLAASLSTSSAAEGGPAAWAVVASAAGGAVTAVLVGPDGAAAELPPSRTGFTAAAVACRPDDAASGVAVVLAGPRGDDGAVPVTLLGGAHRITIGGDGAASASVAAAGEGHAVRLLPVVAVSKTSAARLRAVLVSDDAAVTASSRAASAAPAWSRDESRASVRAVVSVEPPLPEGDRLDAGALSLASRLAGQAEEARRFAAGLADAATAFAADPSLLLNPSRGRDVIGRAFPTLTDPTGGQAFDRAIVFASKPDAPGMRPVLSAALAIPPGGDGASEPLWRRALPLARWPLDAVRVPPPACDSPALRLAVRREARTPAGNPSLLVLLACPGGSTAVEMDAWTGRVTSASKLHGPAPAFLSETGHRDADGAAVFLAVTAPAAAGDAVTARFVPDQAPGPALDAALAALAASRTVLALPVRRDVDGATTGVAGFRLSPRPDGSLVGRRAWQASAAPGEDVLAVSLPAPEEWQASQASELQQAKALADGSLLLEHKAELVALVTGTSQAGQAAGGDEDGDEEDRVPSVSVRLLEAATGRVSHAQTHLRAKGPVRLAWLSDTVAYSLWNDEAHRFELSVLSLFAGSLEPFQLNPLSAPAGASAGAGVPGLSSAPLVRQRTFALPVSPARLATTATRHGVTAHALLVGLGSGGVLAIDRKLIDPRRPEGTPTANDVAEGLVPFDPALPLAHAQVVTHAREVARLRSIDSVPTHMESASVVVATGLDVVVTRASPSGSFDTLDNDFSFLTIVALLAVGSVAVVVAKFLMQQALVKRAWM